MPELKPLPCPACDEPVHVFGGDSWDNKNRFFITCQNKECGVCSVGDTVREDCISRWNALPRALRWTTEPPKVAGVYLIRSMFDGEQQGEIGVITVKTPFGYDKSHFMQFAGPIALPVEVLAS